MLTSEASSINVRVENIDMTQNPRTIYNAMSFVFLVSNKSQELNIM